MVAVYFFEYGNDSLTVSTKAMVDQKSKVGENVRECGTFYRPASGKRRDDWQRHAFSFYPRHHLEPFLAIQKCSLRPIQLFEAMLSAFVDET